MKRKIFRKLALVLTMSVMLGLTGCGANDPAGDVNESVEVPVENKEAVPAPAETPAPTISDNMKSLLGEWIMIGMDTESYFYMTDDQEGTATVSFYEEDGKVKADYQDNYYNTLEIYGAVLSEQKEKAYETAANNWHGEFARKEKANGDVRYFKVVVEGDVLHVVEHNDYLYQDYETGEMVNDFYERNCLYVKADAPNQQEIIDSYRYMETVTVSNVKELYNAIGSRKHIILKGGVYNLSDLTDADRNNSHINRGGYYDDERNEYVEYDIAAAAIYMRSLDNIYFEGEAGAEVLIVTEDAAESPFQMENCANIVMKNLTLGHEVEPGACSGAVLSMYDCFNMTIEECHLFGCGTYGFDAAYCRSVDVKNCDVYECSEGLAYLINCSGWNVTGTNFRDTIGYCMFALSGSGEMVFDNCVIKNNICWGETDCFISADEYYRITFSNCTFQGNSYKNLYVGNVIFDNCIFED